MGIVYQVVVPVDGREIIAKLNAKMELMATTVHTNVQVTAGQYVIKLMVNALVYLDTRDSHAAKNAEMELMATTVHTNVQVTAGCKDGTWGPNCTLLCSAQCYNGICNGQGGYCTDGCIEGFYKPNCSDTCERHHYGRNCLSECSSNCVNKICERKNGVCYVCYPGYQGNFCDKECNSTKFGQNCSLHCNSSCLDRLCHPVTGKCLLCPTGKIGNQCYDCPHGTFGVDCFENCSSNCKPANVCHPVNGTCMGGCQDGYQGETCNIICDNNTYGAMCGNNCSMNCMASDNNETTVCNHINGSCLHGCVNGFGGSLCFQAIVTPDASPPVGAIVGIIIAVLVITVLIVIGVYLWKRRRSTRQKVTRKDSQGLTNIQQTESSLHNKRLTVSTNNSNDEEDFVPDIIYYNTLSDLSVNMSMSVQELNTFMLSHDKDFFDEQFKKIPQAKDVSMEVALMDENKSKNRYRNISPYDHSRIHLLVNTGKKEGDYINASYIQDHNGKAKFIAAQGPNSLVVNDFVRMLWEQNVETVVMLANFVEEGKVKCDRYWPESGKTSFGDIKVKLKNTQTFADYCIRRIELSKSNEEVRMFTHFHFTAWPDQGVPAAPWALVDFHQRVFATSTDHYTVVHCSAGVGRTGTFIALHNVINQARETGKVDFYNTLVKLRRDRIFMVQTADQYEFLHKAALAAIVCSGTTVTVSDISDRVHDLEAKEISGLTKMKKELQMVNTVCKVIRRSDDSVNKPDKGVQEKIYQNTPDLQTESKNRFSNIIPRRFDRPYLACDLKSKGDYINAVFTPVCVKQPFKVLVHVLPLTKFDSFISVFI
ncbi:hypothetical protein Btru_017747 [Bulinus truncatus]|nr:hypothetical protein Btru_017747 [Bulinus truncatus]